MLKKMMLLALSVGALVAFAAPAAAQANVRLTENGTALANGAEITATSTNLVTETVGGGTLICEKVTLHLEVVENGLTHVELKQLGAATTTNCTASGVLPATIFNGGVTENITINTWGTSNTNATFLSKVYFDAEHTQLAQECDYAGTFHIVPVGPSDTDTIKVTESPLTAPGCENAHIEGTFTLETSGGAEVTLDYTETV